MEIRENELLSRHTTMRTGGAARYFAMTETMDDILRALSWASARALPVFVLGGGSNVLASDEGFPGLIIRIATCGVERRVMADGRIELIAEAGETWDKLVEFAVRQGGWGLENLSLIPGTVGAAVAGNIGAYGSEVKDSLAWAEALDRRTGELRCFSNAECAFAYRHSFFKTEEGRRFIVIRAAFELRPEAGRISGHEALQNHFARTGENKPDLETIRLAVMDIRRQKLPDMGQTGTAGSFFKNPVISKEQYLFLCGQHPGLPGYPDETGRMKVPLGWILDKICGLKGMRRGKVGTHPQQSLVIVNDGGTAAEVESFAAGIQQIVLDKTGLRIEWEVEKLGNPTPCPSDKHSHVLLPG